MFWSKFHHLSQKLASKTARCVEWQPLLFSPEVALATQTVPNTHFGPKFDLKMPISGPKKPESKTEKPEARKARDRKSPRPEKPLTKKHEPENIRPDPPLENK